MSAEWKLKIAMQDDAAAGAQISAALAHSPAATAAYQTLTEAGGTVYVVGGAVRDGFLGKTPKDVDLLVAGLEAEAVHQALGSLGTVKLTGDAFGVFRLAYRGDEVEVALPRTEVSTGEGHRDFEVQTDPSLPIEADLGRRDFTANAIAFDPATGTVIDPYGGRAHIEDGVLTTVNETAFQDDPLRIVRALVAQASHGLAPDDATLNAMRANAHGIKHLPGERISPELDKLLKAEDPVEALEIAHETGVLRFLLPEVEVCFGFRQHNRHHDLDVGSHLLAVLTRAAQITDDPDVRMAALLHDIGKPDSFWLDTAGQGHFYKHPDYPESENHEELGADKSKELLLRLRYPTDRVEHIVKLISLHMFPPFGTLKGARKFLRKAGDIKTANDLLDLREADKAGKGWNKTDFSDIEMMRRLVKHALETGAVINRSGLAIGGKEIMSLGVPQGPEVGEILNELHDFVIDHPSFNTHDALMRIAPKLIADR